MKSAILLLALSALVSVLSAQQAQTGTMIPDRPSCGSCRVAVREVARLGSINDPAGFGPLAYVAVSSGGSYAVSSATFPGEIFLYSASGAFVRSVGRRGDGPGEFRGQLLLQFDARDSLHVVEFRGDRHTVLRPGDLAYVRSMQLTTRPTAFTVLYRGGFLLAGPSGTPGSAYALQFLSPEGGRVASADSDARAHEVPRVVTVGTNGSVWTASAVEYRLQEWSERGEPLRTLHARREWLQGSPVPTRLAPQAAPPSQLTGLARDASGLLLVFFAVPDARWAPPVGREAPDPSQMYDTILEVVDPGSGQLMLRHRFEELVIPVKGSLAYVMRSDALGERRIHVLELAVRR